MPNSDFRGELKAENNDAYLFFDGDHDVWVDKEHVREMTQVGRKPEDYEVTIPEWLAISKGII